MTYLALRNSINKNKDSNGNVTQIYFNSTVEKMDIFLVGDRITVENYDELKAMMVVSA